MGGRKKKGVNRSSGWSAGRLARLSFPFERKRKGERKIKKDCPGLRGKKKDALFSSPIRGEEEGRKERGEKDDCATINRSAAQKKGGDGLPLPHERGGGLIPSLIRKRREKGPRFPSSRRKRGGKGDPLICSSGAEEKEGTDSMKKIAPAIGALKKGGGKERLIP